MKGGKRTEEKIRQEILEGYRRIAFGGVQDPVRLLFCEEVSPRTLKSMDLFNVSEVKRPKGGGMEIKFFDRIRALQCMQELGGAGQSVSGFYQALEQGARALEREAEVPGAGEGGGEEGAL